VGALLADRAEQQVGKPTVPAGATAGAVSQRDSNSSISDPLPRSGAVSRSASRWQAFPERGEHVVGARFAQLLDTEVTAGNPDAFDAGSMGRRDVEWSVADCEAPFRVDRLTEHQRRPLESLLGQLEAVVRVRAVTTKAEKAVEAGPVELDVRCRLPVPGHQPKQIAPLEQPRQQLLDTGKDAVARLTRERGSASTIGYESVVDLLAHAFSRRRSAWRRLAVEPVGG
jgi:hypothetical protein